MRLAVGDVAVGDCVSLCDGLLDAVALGLDDAVDLAEVFELLNVVHVGDVLFKVFDRVVDCLAVLAMPAPHAGMVDVPGVCAGIFEPACDFGRHVVAVEDGCDR